MANRIFIPTKSAEDWKGFLAEPEKQWRKGFSARTLAHCWETADGFPPEVRMTFARSEITTFQKVEMLLALPEYKVYLPPANGHPSQNDLFVLAKGGAGELISIMVEGKVSEPFDKTIGEWNPASSKGKTIRFDFLKDMLNLQEISPNVHYQFLHRTASAVIEARNFNAQYAVMLVHSFNQENLWFDKFVDFAALFGIRAQTNHLHFAKILSGISLYLGWVKGDPLYLTA